MSQSWQGLKSGDEETPTCLYDRIQPWHMNRRSISVFIVLPWYLCQRLLSGNRSSYQRRTFCPDTKCLSAGHKCNLSAQRVLNIQINNLTIACLHVKRRPETYSVWVSHLCWPPWTTCDTECSSLITEKKKNRKEICFVGKAAKTCQICTNFCCDAVSLRGWAGISSFQTSFHSHWDSASAKAAPQVSTLQIKGRCLSLKSKVTPEESTGETYWWKPQAAIWHRLIYWSTLSLLLAKVHVLHLALCVSAVVIWGLLTQQQLNL